MSCQYTRTSGAQPLPSAPSFFAPHAHHLVEDQFPSGSLLAIAPGQRRALTAALPYGGHALFVAYPTRKVKAVRRVTGDKQDYHVLNRADGHASAATPQLGPSARLLTNSSRDYFTSAAGSDTRSLASMSERHGHAYRDKAVVGAKHALAAETITSGLVPASIIWSPVNRRSGQAASKIASTVAVQADLCTRPTTWTAREGPPRSAKCERIT